MILVAAQQGLDIGNIIVPVVTALIAAMGAIAVAWRRLTVLGHAERGKLEAEKADIIQTAEDRATARALEALKVALDVTERERDRAYNELAAAREELRDLRSRLTDLERLLERRKEDILPNPGRRAVD